MTYRDEVEALRAQLAEKQAEIDALKKQATRAHSKEGLTVSRWLGLANLELQSVVPHEIHVDDQHQVVAVIRQTLSTPGMPSILGRALLFWGDAFNLQISVTPENGQTTIKTSERYEALARLGYATVVFASVGSFVSHSIRQHPSWDELLVGFVVGLLMFGLMAVGVRMLAGRVAVRLAARTRQLHGRVESAVRAAISARTTKSQVRIAEDLVEHDHEDEVEEGARMDRAQRDPA